MESKVSFSRSFRWSEVALEYQNLHYKLVYKVKNNIENKRFIL